MRGKRYLAQARPQKGGITPACAGKTSEPHRLYRGAEDHPRVCGENSPELALKAFIVGSPPRVRGKRSLDRRTTPAVRITPACAGKTCYCPRNCSLRRDHPRVCGENQDSEDTDSIYLGSPPRVRGKPHEQKGAERVKGITPACAGKTTPHPPMQRARQDHPRVCGEN